MDLLIGPIVLAIALFDGLGALLVGLAWLAAWPFAAAARRCFALAHRLQWGRAGRPSFLDEPPEADRS